MITANQRCGEGANIGYTNAQGYNWAWKKGDPCNLCFTPEQNTIKDKCEQILYYCKFHWQYDGKSSYKLFERPPL
ncbi:hypothetical protein EG68_00940 [Paragonimus skrjabini miyazakii]|uniref:Uncharacterized protein n=1 Tax=Paragonimus skrjabini miyazakii TaxID=59628 RepID=A0A8S9Z7N1_9TREM|nr:hypothetical protein EG68_00940 [Paragonimus skrjabini miyazakii]